MVLRGAGERRAALGHEAVAQPQVQRAPADAVAGLEHEHRTAGALDRPRGGQPREPRPDDDHVGPAGTAARGAGGGLGGERGGRAGGQCAADQPAAVMRESDMPGN